MAIEGKMLARVAGIGTEVAELMDWRYRGLKDTEI